MKRCVGWIWLLLSACASRGDPPSPGAPRGPEIRDAEPRPDAASDGGQGGESSDPEPPPIDAGMGTPCNGETRLCDQPYGDSTSLATHVSAATRVAGWHTITQNLSLAEQLRSDVVALTLEIFDDSGELVVCHRDCASGRARLSTVLGEVKTFLDENPLRTTTLLIECHASVTDLSSAFAGVELGSYLYRHAGADVWPTLGELIERNERLVVFVSSPDSDGASNGAGGMGGAGGEGSLPPEFHATNRWIRQTVDTATDASGIDCAVERGEPDAPWLLLHQHVSDPATGAPSEELAATVNSNPIFLDRLETCRSVHARLPSFVVIDFVEVGNPQTTVRQLNAGLPP